jgi:hypothetical protein
VRGAPDSRRALAIAALPIRSLACLEILQELFFVLNWNFKQEFRSGRPALLKKQDLIRNIPSFVEEVYDLFRQV